MTVASPPQCRAIHALGAAILFLASTGTAMAGEQEIEAHRRVSAQAVDATGLDRMMLSTAQARLAGDPKFQEQLDQVLYRLRPAILWDAKHPAWAPARATLVTVARDETSRQIREYWKELQPLVAREIESTFTPPEAEMLLEFATTPGGRIYFERRLAELRERNGPRLYDLDPESAPELARRASAARKSFESLPAPEKQRVEAFLAGAKCPRCARAPATVMERFLAGEAEWLTGVLIGQFGSTHGRASDRWIADIDAKHHASLPVDSKKQVLGVLEMRKDFSLGFRAASLTLEFARGHPNYDEVLALAPGLSAGKPRVLYRDERGIIGDQP